MAVIAALGLSRPEADARHFILSVSTVFLKTESQIEAGAQQIG